MRLVKARIIHTVHQEAIAQQRHVECPSIEGADRVVAHQRIRNGLQQKPFLRIIAHHQLMNLESRIRQAAHADLERDSPRAHKPGGFGVQIEDVPRVEIVRQFFLRHQAKGGQIKVKRAGKFG